MKKTRLLLMQTSLVSSLTAIYGSLALAQVATAPAAAASAPAAESAKAETLDAVMVTGFRASLMRASEVKRNANSVVDAISAEDIGKFPDRNAAESLSHLPGISVDRQFGEGEKISINGTDPALNRVLVNGQTIASGNWGGYPLDNSGRTFNYTLLAPEIIGLMEVYKSSEARIDEGSIGGTVIVNTRKPLDLPNQTLRGSVAYGYNDRSKLGAPRASVLGSWKTADNTLGFLAAVTHDEQKISRAGIETFYYADGSGLGGGNPVTITGTGDPSKAKMPFGLSSAYFSQDRKRDGVQSEIQWRPNKENELSLSGVYVKGHYDNFSQSRYICPGCDKAYFTAAGLENGFITSGTVTPTANNQLESQQDANYRQSTVTTSSLLLRHDLKLDDWRATTQVGTTRATGGKSPEYLQKFRLTSGGYKFNYGAGSANVTYDNPAASNWALPASPAGSPAGDPTLPGVNQAGGLEYTTTVDREHYLQFDVKRNLDWGIINQVMVGAKYIDHDNSQFSYGNRINTTSAINLSQFGGGSSPSGLWDGLGASGDLVNWTVADKDAVLRYLMSQPQGPMQLKKGQIFDVAEKTKNLYTQFNFDHEDWRGNFGLRYVNTANDAGYYFSSTGADADYVYTNSKRSYSRVLPSLNVVYDLAKDKTLRFSVAKVIARPRYSDLAAQTQLDNVTHTGGGGNPDLKPYEATNVDLAGEWYFSKDSMVGAEVFYRDIKNYIVSDTKIQQYADSSNGGKMTDYLISSPVNARGAKVKGLSLMYNQALPAGFGVQSNWTYTEANTPPDLKMPFLSRNTFNLIPYFESGPWSARMSFSYRSKYFTQVSQLKGSWFADSYKQLDMSGSYEINKQITLTASVSNLLDSTYYWYYGERYAPIGSYKNGRSLSLGLNFKL